MLLADGKSCNYLLRDISFPSVIQSLVKFERSSGDSSLSITSIIMKVMSTGEVPPPGAPETHEDSSWSFCNFGEVCISPNFSLLRLFVDQAANMTTTGSCVEHIIQIPAVIKSLAISGCVFIFRAVGITEPLDQLGFIPDTITCFVQNMRPDARRLVVGCVRVHGS